MGKKKGHGDLKIGPKFSGHPLYQMNGSVLSVCMNLCADLNFTQHANNAYPQDAFG